MSVVEVVGSINVDLVTTTPRVPSAGETLKASSFAVGFGGKGANQAVSCAHMLSSDTTSSRVKMVGAVGDDQFGQDSLNQLKGENIDHSNVKIFEGEKTGTTVVIVEERSGQNRILFTPGANYSVTADHVVLDQSHRGNVVLFQLELPFETVMQGLKTARSMGKTTMLNPAPASPLPDDCYPNLDHLIVNESEAAILARITEEELAGSLDEVAQTFIDKGVKVLIITLGADGVYWKLASETSQKGQRIQAHRVKAVDTTAAGDVFVGAYAAYLTETGAGASIDGGTVKSAVEFANRAASISVQRHGAQASIPHRKDLAG